MFLSKTEVFLRIFRKTYTMQRHWTQILLINFHSPWKHQKNMDFLMISGGIEGICLNSVRVRSEIKRRSLNFTRFSLQFLFRPLSSVSFFIITICSLFIDKFHYFCGKSIKQPSSSSLFSSSLNWKYAYSTRSTIL